MESARAGRAIWAERVLAFMIFLVWAILLWSVAVIKIHSDGINKFISHFTNWAWIFQIYLFTVDVLSRFEKKKRASFVLALIFFWIVNAITWMVFWLVWIALDNNPGLLESETKEHGGKFDSGFVFNMNTLFHVIPSIMILLYTVLRRYELRYAVAFVTDGRIFPGWMSGITATIIVFIAPGLLSTIYVTTTDIVQVYKLTVKAWLPIIVALGVILVHNVIPFVIFYLQAEEMRHKITRYPISL